jgi:hypothetical protein
VSSLAKDPDKGPKALEPSNVGVGTDKVFSVGNMHYPDVMPPDHVHENDFSACLDLQRR